MRLHLPVELRREDCGLRGPEPGKDGQQAAGEDAGRDGLCRLLFPGMDVRGDALRRDLDALRQAQEQHADAEQPGEEREQRVLDLRQGEGEQPKRS